MYVPRPPKEALLELLYTRDVRIYRRASQETVRDLV